MSEENVEVVRSILAAWEKGDFSSADWADPDIEYSPPHDRRLSRGVTEMDRRFGEWIAAWENLRVSAEDPRVSPINGDLSGLGPITLFSGTHDILNSDAKRFVPLAREAGVSIDYHQAPGMPHEYPLFPIPEAKRARQAIIEALTT